MGFKFYLTITVLFFSLCVFPQKGKTGAGSITAANTKVNEFTALASDAAIGTATINVVSSGLNTNSRFSTILAPGDLIMVIQMQGALIKLIPTPIWAPDSTYGNVYNYGTCGNYEFAEVKSIISGTQIEINCGLTYAYSSAGKTQIVRVPRYSSLNIASTGTLTTDAWNGTTGGVLAVEVNGNTTINSGGLISANALGFRGGVPFGDPGTGNGNFVTKNPDDGAEKGEGIGSDRLINSAATNDTLGKQCKGAPANGGGGGNANNCGGGGGGNAGNLSIYYGLGVPNTAYSTAFNLEFSGRASVISSGGGKGGYGTSTVNGNPNTNPPFNTFWGSFKRPNYGGFGGRPLDYSTGKIYMGGGGGAGHKSTGQSNGANAGAGGTGGGIIYLLNYGTISGTGTISANGANGVNSFGTPSISNPTQGIDGAGGAGAGGTIILKSNGSISSVTTNANGGAGGNQVITGTASNEGQGPGGGGSGGYIAGNGSSFTQNVNGGIYGVTNAVAFASAFPMNGATSGNSGLNNQLIPTYTLTPSSSSQTLCANQSTTLSATSTDASAAIQWYNTVTGGNAIATGTLYTTPTYTAAGTYTVYAGSCPGIYRQPIIITVTSGLTISVASTTICSGQTAVLTASGATTYTWVAGPATNTISVSPAATSVYTVNGTSGSCTGSQTATVTVGSGITVNVNSPTVCAGTNTVLTASGATTYTWSTGSNTNTVSVAPSSTTVYTVSGSVGSCTSTVFSTVTVNSRPTLTLTASAVNICSGQSSTLTASGATTYTWSNSVNGSSQTVSPTGPTVYSVTGTNGSGCTNITPATVSINIVPTPTISVNNPTICPGQSAILTPTSAATSYTWNTSQTTNTISVSPTVTTVYTVTGSNGTCSSLQTSTVTVSPGLSISVNNPTICSGQSAILTPTSSATSYTWSTSQTTNTISVSPVSTAIYTVTGANATCSGTQTATVTIGSNVTITVNSASVCAGTNTLLTASGASSYTWNTGATTNTLNVTPSATTVYTVTGSISTCTGTATSTVSVNTGPTLTLTALPANICTGQSTSLSATGANTYTWSNSVQSSTQTVSPVVTTTYSVTGTNSAGCLNATPFTITINVTPIPTVSATSATVCAGQSATLTANGTASYTWSTGETTAVINPSPGATTTYTVSGSNGGCSSDITTTVTVKLSPTLSLIPAATTGCSPLCVNFSDAVSPSSSTIVYNFGDGATGTVNNPLHCYIGIGNYTVNAVATDPATGCSAALVSPVVITLSPRPLALFSVQEGTLITEGSTIHLINNSTNAVSYIWNLYNAAYTTTNVTATAIDTGKCCITLYALSSAGCSDTVTECITVINDASISVPNVFTPNNDAKNDLFKIKTSGIKSLSCGIYDRWGLKVYEWDGINGYWDGKTKSGAAAVDGSYFYIINYTDFKDVSKTEKGFLSLFRN